MIKAARNIRLGNRLRVRLRRLVSGAMEHGTPVAFVVPGPDVARALGLDLEAAGLEVSATPRHAGVLVLVGGLTESLREAASVARAQMPRPRVVLAVGTEGASPSSPEADFSVPLGQEALARGVAEARRRLAEKALEGEENEEGHGGHEAAGRDRVDPGSMGHSDEHDREDPESPVNREGADHGHMDHGDMGFMSMAAMTEGTPRSSDGLQMEWVAAPFGPLFAGLPGGLALTLTLDGDAVAESGAESVVGMPRLEGMSGPAETFAEWLAGLDPLSPVAYRVLALRAFENAIGLAPDERTTLARIGALERERAASHLGWLAGFGHLTGHARLASRAGKLQLALLRAGGSGGEPSRLRAAGASEISRLKVEANKLVENLRRNPLLARRLKGVGAIPEGTDASGPVARARGADDDARADDEDYRGLGFEAVAREGDDALSRLRVRLAEVGHSLDLILAAGSISVPSHSFDYDQWGKGEATVETPRGKASLRLSLRGGRVRNLELHTPSTQHIALVEDVAEGRELADALVGVASLDISPWEVLH